MPSAKSEPRLPNPTEERSPTCRLGRLADLVKSPGCQVAKSLQAAAAVTRKAECGNPAPRAAGFLLAGLSPNVFLKPPLEIFFTSPPTDITMRITNSPVLFPGEIGFNRTFDFPASALDNHGSSNGSDVYPVRGRELLRDGLGPDGPAKFCFKRYRRNAMRMKLDGNHEENYGNR